MTGFLDMEDHAKSTIKLKSLQTILNYIKINDIDDTEMRFAISVLYKEDLPYISTLISNENPLPINVIESEFMDLMRKNRVKILTMTDFKRIPGNTVCRTIHRPPAYVIYIEVNTYFG